MTTQRRFGVVTTDDLYKYEEQQAAAIGTRPITLPAGIQFYQLPKDTGATPFIKVDILPFVTDTANGKISIPRANYFVHNNIDGNRTNVICPHLHKGLPCPICEYGNAISWPENKVFRPQNRQLYAIVLPDSTEPEKIWVMEFAQWTFGRVLDEKIKSCDPKDPTEMKWREFADLENGWSVKVNLKPGAFNGNAYTDVSSVDFKPRLKQYTEDMYDKVPDLMSVFNILSYEEIKKRFRPSAMMKKEDSPAVSTATAVQHAIHHANGSFDPTSGYNPMVQPAGSTDEVPF